MVFVDTVESLHVASETVYTFADRNSTFVSSEGTDSNAGCIPAG